MLSGADPSVDNRAGTEQERMASIFYDPSLSFSADYSLCRIEPGLQIVVKQPRAHQQTEEAVRRWRQEMIVREMNILKTCRHRHIILLLGTSETIFAGQICSLFPLMELGNIREVIENRCQGGSAFLKLRALIWFYETALAVEYLHSDCIGVIHGDLRGENIFIDRELRVKLAHFGYAVFD